MPGVGIPEITWGIYKEKVTGIVHYAPAIEGRFMKPHVVSENCSCGPEISQSEMMIVVVHKVIH